MTAAALRYGVPVLHDRAEGFAVASRPLPRPPDSFGGVFARRFTCVVLIASMIGGNVPGVDGRRRYRSRRMIMRRRRRSDRAPASLQEKEKTASPIRETARETAAPKIRAAVKDSHLNCF